MRNTGGSRLTHVQFTLRGIVDAIAVTGLILGFFAWLLRLIVELQAVAGTPFVPGFAMELTIVVGPYSLSSDSSAFWLLVCSGIALLLGCALMVRHPRSERYPPERMLMIRARANGCLPLRSWCSSPRVDKRRRSLDGLAVALRPGYADGGSRTNRWAPPV
jgi:hypothetical protein